MLLHSDSHNRTLGHPKMSSISGRQHNDSNGSALINTVVVNNNNNNPMYTGNNMNSPIQEKSSNSRRSNYAGMQQKSRSSNSSHDALRLEDIPHAMICTGQSGSFPSQARSGIRVCRIIGRHHRTFTIGSAGGIRLLGFHVDLPLDVFPGPLVTEFDLAGPLGTKESIPEDEERLGEIALDSPALMMDIVVSGIVVGQVL